MRTGRTARGLTAARNLLSGFALRPTDPAPRPSGPSPRAPRNTPSPAERTLRLTVPALLATCALSLLTGGSLPTGSGRTDPDRPLATLTGAALQLFTGLLCARAARRNNDRPPALTGWTLLALSHTICAVLQPTALLGLGPDRAEKILPLTAALVHGPLLLAAIWLLARDSTPRWLRSAWWDAAVTGSCAAAASLTVALRTSPGNTPWDTVPPLSCALLIASVVAVLTLTGTPLGPVMTRLVAGVTLVSTGEMVVLQLTEHPDPTHLWALRLLPLTGHALIALAALAATTGSPFRDRRARPPGGPRTVLLPWTAALTGLALAGLATIEGLVPDIALLLAVTGTGTYLVKVGSAALLRSGARLPGPPAPWAQSGRGSPGTDELTGLANRQELARLLTAPGRTPTPADRPERVWLLLADIDRFKEINEALGHEAGDLVLTEVSRRFRTTLRDGQVLARLGADEFAVLLPGTGRETAIRVARDLRQVLIEPLEVAGQRLHVRASVGIAGCPLRQENTEDLLRQVTVAVHRAKGTGNGIEVYDPARDKPDAARLRRIDELRGALANGGLEVFLQPQVSLANGTVVGVEALARWRHPQDGVLLPDTFLPLAAQTGLMRPVTALVLDSSLDACSRWWRGRRIPVSVNLTADDLQDPDLPELVERCLDRHGLPPTALRVEITEDAVLPDPAAVAALLRAWRSSGITVALDDYGTGYSSLAYLHELPLDSLKLDKVFVTNLDRRPTATIVQHTVAMAHGLGLGVVAEGVEDRSTARRLADVGCDTAQGLFFGPATDLPGFLHRLVGERTG
ncbi:MAG: bifunctional diguanylate cyclase/phosphodiesterase [Actinomycetota bacterium]|nr:bifunctional diguanylate cyclase/phosphodiesterase [Actinomycetota bacterium]